MQNIVNEIIEWQEEIFPAATTKAVEEKLEEEAYELWSALYNMDGVGATSDEIADVFIVACRWCKMNGLNVQDIIRDKMAINRQREFGPELANGDRKRIK